MIWRIATHPRIRDSLHTIQTDWSLDDLMQAHDVVDALEDAESRAHAAALANAGRSR
jgi:hypothetical protein